MKNVTITWIGHSCFAVEKEGYRILFDPYEDGYVPGLANLREEADLILSSHGHGDHTAPETCARIRKEAAGKTCPWEITELRSYHDKAQGRQRGENVIRILSDGQYRIAHMGDIGCMPAEAQTAALAGLDVMLVPVGGHFTLEPDEVKKLVGLLQPRVVVPMHYRSDKDGFGFPVIAELSAYTALCDDVVYHDGDTLVLPEDLVPQTAVLRCRAAVK